MKLRLLSIAVATLVSSASFSVQAAPPETKPGASTPVEVTNTPSNPVPVSIPSGVAISGGPIAVTPPLWQGTPSIVGGTVLQQNANGFEYCQSFFTAGAGQALLFKTVTGTFNVPPGTFGSMRLKVKVLGSSTSIRFDVPMHATAPALQVAGLYDQYSGSLDGGGIPIISAEACVSGVNAAGDLSILGFVVTP